MNLIEFSIHQFESKLDPDFKTYHNQMIGFRAWTMEAATIILIGGKQEGKGKREENMFSAVQCSYVRLDLWLKQTALISTAGRCGVPDSLRTNVSFESGTTLLFERDHPTE